MNNNPTIPSIREYYKENENAIKDYGYTRPLNFYYSYPFDWSLMFTPIELDAWQIIRSLGKVVLYPQYPILNYRADFANPTKRIVLECDGKQYHSYEKDIKRDERLYDQGWKTFRVTGSELYKVAKLEYDEDQQCYTQDSLEEYYLHSAEGVIQAIRDVFFIKQYMEDNNQEMFNYYETGIYAIQLQALQQHSLLDFQIY